MIKRYAITILCFLLFTPLLSMEYNEAQSEYEQERERKDKEFAEFLTVFGLPDIDFHFGEINSENADDGSRRNNASLQGTEPPAKRTKIEATPQLTNEKKDSEQIITHQLSSLERQILDFAEKKKEFSIKELYDALKQISDISSSHISYRVQKLCGYGFFYAYGNTHTRKYHLAQKPVITNEAHSRDPKKIKELKKLRLKRIMEIAHQKRSFCMQDLLNHAKWGITPRTLQNDLRCLIKKGKLKIEDIKSPKRKYSVID